MKKKVSIFFCIIIVIISATAFSACSIKNNEKAAPESLEVSKTNEKTGSNEDENSSSYQGKIEENSQSSKVEFTDKIIIADKNIDEVIFKDFTTEEIKPKIETSSDKKKIKEIADLVESQTYKKIDGNWAIKTSPDSPRYSITLKSENELTINFGGDLGDLGYLAIVNASSRDLYEVPLELYNKLLAYIK